MDQAFRMRYRDIGLVGIVFVIPGGNFNLSFTVIYLQNLHNYTLLLGRATRNIILFYLAKQREIHSLLRKDFATLRRLTPSCTELLSRVL
jgi:hypothetical protein